jgi:hypothetical protein
MNDQSKAVYNYRLFRGRRTTENSFDILCEYFRIFFQTIVVAPETIDKLITCACILHHILREAKVLAAFLHWTTAQKRASKTPPYLK